ncbi:hypothetical protein LQZ18_18390 [Lachnospiraceae bacterium ZAX-1]
MNLRKLFIGVLLATVIGDPQLQVMATEPQLSNPAPASEQITPRAEKTQWYYQSVGGRLQKRLWSITYGVWRSDWMWV